MKLLLLFLCLCTPVFGQTISTITLPFTGSLTALTPSTVFAVEAHTNMFYANVPSNWTKGEAYTFVLTFNGNTITGSANAWMPWTQFSYYFPMNTDAGVLIKSLTQTYPATITVTYANGGTATESFII